MEGTDSNRPPDGGVSDFNEWDELFLERHGPLSGTVLSLKQAENLIREFSIDSQATFVVNKTMRKNFGSSEILPRKYKVAFQGRVPYVILNSKLYSCQFGKQQHKAKAKQGKDNARNRKYVSTKCFEKIGCLAGIKMKEIILFPEWAIEDDTQYRRHVASAKVRWLLPTTKDLDHRRRIMIQLPDSSEHSHKMGKIGKEQQPIEKVVIKEIGNLVGLGIHDPYEMQKHLEQFAMDKFLSQETTRESNRLFPDLEQIKQEASLALARRLYRHNDQDNLMVKVDEWKKAHPEDNFYCQMRKANMRNREVDKFLFVVQTHAQKKLLARYGQLCMLDPAYRTMHLPLPLFFLCVRTNVNFEVVAAFVCQNGSCAEIKRALSIIRDWNNNWTADIVLTDFAEDELKAVEATIVEQDCLALVGDFFRERAWEKWASSAENCPVGKRDEVLIAMRHVAMTATELEFVDAVNHLEQGELWRGNSKLQTWFNTAWIPEYKRWVWASRSDALKMFLQTGDDLEHQTQLSTHFTQLDKTSLTVTQLGAILVESYFPACHKRYIDNNSVSRHRLNFATTVPSFLHNRPLPLVKHCMERLEAAAKIPRECVKEVQERIVDVRNASHLPEYVKSTVTISPLEMPSCSCEDWHTHFLPCQHMFAALIHLPGYNFDMLCDEYRNSCYLTVDDTLTDDTLTRDGGTDTISHDTPMQGDTDQAMSLPLQQRNARNKSSTGGAMSCDRSGHYAGIANNCRRLIDQIDRLTYRVSDTATLETAAVHLRQSLDMLRRTANVKCDDSTFCRAASQIQSCAPSTSSISRPILDKSSSKRNACILTRERGTLLNEVAVWDDLISHEASLETEVVMPELDDITTGSKDDLSLEVFLAPTAARVANVHTHDVVIMKQL